MSVAKGVLRCVVQFEQSSFVRYTGVRNAHDSTLDLNSTERRKKLQV